jgi:hypothetical protein
MISINALVLREGVFDGERPEELREKLPPDRSLCKQPLSCGHAFCTKKAKLCVVLTELESSIQTYEEMSTAQRDPQISALTAALVASKAALIAEKVQIWRRYSTLLFRVTYWPRAIYQSCARQ